MDRDPEALDVVQLCAAAADVFANGFFMAHADKLRPLVAVVAEKYRASVAWPRELDGLRFSGNDMVLMVASIQGGRDLVEMVGRQLWPLVRSTQ